MHGPSPNAPYPLPGFLQESFIKNTVNNPHIRIAIRQQLARWDWPGQNYP